MVAKLSTSSKRAKFLPGSVVSTLPRTYQQFRQRSASFAAAVLTIALLAGCFVPNLQAQASLALYGPSGVTPSAVRQGVLGSCYFHASLAAVAKADPAAIRRTLSGDAQAGYRIHFLTGPDELVFAEDVEYARSHNYDRSEGLWVTILMRGYAQRQLRHGMVEAIRRSTVIPVFVKPVALSMLDQSGPLLVAYDRAIRSVVSQDGQLDKAQLQAQLAKQLSILGVPEAQAETLGGMLQQGGFYEALNRTVSENGEVFGAYRSLGQGGIPFSVIEALLGQAHSGPVTQDALLDHLRELHAGSIALVAGTKTTLADPALRAKNPDWYVPSHAYTVLDYDPAAHTVLLRNPWGTRPDPDGVFKLPLSVFQQVYESYSYSDPVKR